MWVSLKALEEEDLIFMNSICCFSYFWSFRRFPGHQQKLPNTSGTWVRLPASEFMEHQPKWIQGENDRGEENISPDCY